MKDDGYRSPEWWGSASEVPQEHQPEYWNDARFNGKNQPVVGVSWYEAAAYARWLTFRVFGEAALRQGRGYRLASEAEHEAAAQGTEGRQYAYGNTYDPLLGNTRDSHIIVTTPVGMYPVTAAAGSAPVFDLTGNVWEWTRSIYRPYPYRPNDGRENETDREASRTRRGGSWGGSADDARAACRSVIRPAYRSDYVGFRLASVLRPPSLNH
jgi:formylglycine-generating enzyme required for sulfatase activity